MNLIELIENANWEEYCLAVSMLMTASIEISYYFLIYFRTAQHKKTDLRRKKISVSVVICARNEAKNLEKHLPYFLEQNYPDFEIIVVNDCSTDNSEDVLSEMKVNYPQLRYTSIPLDKKFTHGKKLALTIGIKAARFDYLLLSDADCYPASKNWITSMSRHFTREKDIVLGVGKYESKKGLLNLLVRYDTFFTAMQYVSLALVKKPFMGVGRNLGYKKQLFFDNKGFAKHLKVISGDDDLFVNQVANRRNTAVEIETDSFTYSVPPDNFTGWLNQKSRHLTTGKYYKADSKFMLGLEYSSRLLFYAATLTLFFFGEWKWIALGTLFLTTLIKLIVTKSIMLRLKEKDLLLSSLILDILMPLLMGLISLSNILRPRKPRWN